MQVPQYILEECIEGGSGTACNIICTQPRRIAAISVADRVANERGQPAPGNPGSHVGYHVRLDAATTPDTRLLFCTTGILLRRLTGDAQLLSVSHIIVDEVHERTLQGDFLMALLKDLVIARRQMGKPLKVRPLPEGPAHATFQLVMPCVATCKLCHQIDIVYWKGP